MTRITFDILEEYCLFLFRKDGYDDVKREKLHQKLFKSMNGDRIRNRDTKIGRTLDGLICNAMLCPNCEVSVDRDDECFNCHHKLTEDDIKFNIQQLRDKYLKPLA